MSLKDFQLVLKRARLHQNDAQWFPRWIDQFRTFQGKSNLERLEVDRNCVVAFLAELKKRGRPAWTRLQAARAGLRQMECLRIRVKDIEFETGQIIVREGKGDKDRVTVLPEMTVAALRLQIGVARELHERDLVEGYGEVWLPQKRLPRKSMKLPV